MDATIIFRRIDGSVIGETVPGETVVEPGARVAEVTRIVLITQYTL